MTNHFNTPFPSQDKDNELQSFYEYLKRNIATATQAATELKIYRPNVCRYKRIFEKSGRLAVVKKGICPVTKHKAGFLTTNKDLFPIQSQLNLF